MTKPLRLSRKDAARLQNNVAPKAKPPKRTRDQWLADAERGAMDPRLTPRQQAALADAARLLRAGTAKNARRATQEARRATERQKQTISTGTGETPQK